MKLPTIKKILKEDVKDAPGWIGGIIDPVNTFMEGVYTALNRNITFTENISSFVKEITYRTPSTYPSGVDEISFMNDLRTRATGVIVIQAFERANYVPVAITGVAWVETVNGITLSTLLGLAASKIYTVRFLVF